MKIAFYRHSLLNRGGDKMVVTYANYLADRGHEVSIYVNIEDTFFNLNPSVRIVKVPIPGILGTIIWAILARIDADVIVSDIVVLSGVLRFSGKRNTIYFSQGNDIYHYKNSFMRAVIKLFYRLSLGRLCTPCLAVSPKLLLELSEFSGNVAVVPNGIDLLEFQMHSRRSFENKEVVLMFNRSDYSKGTDIGLKALKFIKTCFPDLEVWVIGEKLPDTQYIDRNLGYIDTHQLKQVLKEISLILCPSRHEGFGILVLECLAAGVPVVTTKAVDWLHHCKTGWLSEVNDIDGLRKGILLMLLDRILGRELSLNGLRISKKFDIKKSREEFTREILVYVSGGFYKVQ